MRLCSLAQELTEHLSVNREMLANLRKQAEELKYSAKDVGESYRVRRYNVDVTKEPFESELERNNAACIMENQTLIYENRQLESILKEYEQSMQIVLAKVRYHTQVTSQHEYLLRKHYGSLLSAQERQHSSEESSPSSQDEDFQRSISRLKSLVTVAIQDQHLTIQEVDAGEIKTVPHSPSKHPSIEHQAPSSIDLSTTATEDSLRLDWCHERELEIGRLESENAALRSALGILPPAIPTTPSGIGQSHS